MEGENGYRKRGSIGTTVLLDSSTPSRRLFSGDAVLHLTVSEEALPAEWRT